MSDEHKPAEEAAPTAEATPATEEKSDESEIPSAGKQIAVMAIIVVGITVVLGGGVLLSMWLG